EGGPGDGGEAPQGTSEAAPAENPAAAGASAAEATNAPPPPETTAAPQEGTPPSEEPKVPTGDGDGTGSQA
ncbi:MAG TPA: hypothetical protein VLV17_06625, partial [Anaeromyxobacteraceae bacterium]|nr:hypothetical protein [Anaeromyxobacteraceae bacterium]